MSAFDAMTRAKIESVYTASRLIQIVYSVYAQAKNAQTLITLYQGGTDPVFVAAVNAMLTTQERSEISQMLADINALCTTWEAQHAGVISGG